MSVISQARDCLLNHFGFSEFRDGQAQVVEAVMQRRDCIVVMPTGGGKSLCYQLPSVMLDGITLVVSPLIALMKDQVDGLSQRGLRATFINSALSYPEVLSRLAAIKNGAFKIVYVAPERFRNEAFCRAIAGTRVDLFAVDEAHCVSRWGHDFRPDYLRLAGATAVLGRPPIIALTATATHHVRKDVAAQLGLTDPRIFVAGFDRPNLRLEVVHIGGDKEKLATLRELIHQSKGSGVVYAATRKAVEMISTKLKMAGLSIDAYHAGMTERERTTAQDRFMTGQVGAIAATNAFGMGIDKSDIRFVVHYHVPGSIEAYYQEIGRAGRDGAPANCYLFFNYVDTRTQRFFIDSGHPAPDLVRSVYSLIRRLGQGGREVTARAIQAELGVKNEMSIQSALATLERAGHIQRGRPSDGVVLATLIVSLDNALATTSPTSSEGMLVRHMIHGRGVNDREPTEIDVESLAEETGLGPPLVHAALNTLATRGVISRANLFQGRGVRVLGNAEPDQLRIDARELSLRAAAEHQMLRKMIDYCYSKRCLHGYLLSYFGDAKKVAHCESCSVCALGQSQSSVTVAGDPKAKGTGTLTLKPNLRSHPATVDSFSLTDRADVISDTTAIGQNRSKDGLNESAAPVHRTARQVATPTTLSRVRDDRSEQGGVPGELAAVAGAPAQEGHEDKLPGSTVNYANETEIRDGLNNFPQGIDAAQRPVVKEILGCVARLNGRFGKGTLASVLRGVVSREITTHNLQGLPTFGSLSDLPARELSGFIKSLIKAGCIAVSNSAYPTLSLTDLGREVMHGSGAVRFELPEPADEPID
jgi:ATP-dependent DNA helicase RecQ